jgi:ABC-type sugar transport system permease subunit
MGPHNAAPSAAALLARAADAAPRMRARPWIDGMVLPAVAVLGFVVGYPTVRALILSGYHDQLLDPAHIRFIGAANYTALSRDPVFWTAVRNTVVFTGWSVALGFLLGLGLALLTERLSPSLRWVRGALLTPWAIPVIVVAFLFRYMLDQQVGIVTYLLLRLRAIAAPVPWLASLQWAMPAVVLANVWSQTPFFLLMFTAALKGIPDEIRDAARIDGAGGWQEFWHITVAYLQNAMVIAALIMVINNFNNFPLIWAMTEGGPVYATTTLVVYIFQLAFAQFNLGYAAAVGAVWLVVLLSLTIVYIRALERRPLGTAGGA